METLALNASWIAAYVVSLVLVAISSVPLGINLASLRVIAGTIWWLSLVRLREQVFTVIKFFKTIGYLRLASRKWALINCLYKYKGILTVFGYSSKFLSYQPE